MGREDEILFFVKFGKKKHLEQLINGKGYFSNSGCFNKIEREQMKKGQGDILDGRMLIHAIDAEIKNNITDVIKKIENIIFNIGFEGIDKMLAFCLTAGFIEDCEYHNLPNKYKIKFSRRKEKKIREHFKDADSALLIETPKKFIKCVTQAFKEKCYAGLVHYYDMFKLTIDRLEFLTGEPFDPNNRRVFTIKIDDIYKHLYCKDYFFDEQQEFRFVIPEITITEPKIFEIGKDFKSKLVNINEFFNGIKVGEYGN